MGGSVLHWLLFGVVWFQVAFGLFPPQPQMEPIGLTAQEMASLLDVASPLTGNGTFEQPIDHNNAGLGTFPMSYWFNATYWKGPGSPIIFMTPGESSAIEYTGYLTERAITGLYAKAVGGAVIIAEHRYWGNSTPYAVQTTENLEYLTLHQAVADFVNLAQNLKLPFDTSGKTNAPNAPWVYAGGSYAGALASWIEAISPGVFWAYHGSSAPVQAIDDFSNYFYPIQMGMPQNCSKDYEAIIDHIDSVFMTGSDQDKTSLKEMFAVQDLDHDDDAASAISSPIWLWQNIQFTSNYSEFFQMCDAIEGVIPNVTATYSDQGVGLSKALPNFAKWFKASYLPGYCDDYGYSDWAGEMNVQCFNTYNGSMEAFTDWSDASAVDRPWVWMTCNEPFFYWQTGAPPGTPTVMTRLATAEYYERQCGLYFPTEGPNTYSSALGKTEDVVNQATGGWDNTNTKRLLFSNGEFDPWRSASVSSAFRPGGPFNGTADVPVILMQGSIHCDDLSVKNAIHPSIASAQDAEVKQITAWVNEFYAQKNATATATSSAGGSPTTTQTGSPGATQSGVASGANLCNIYLAVSAFMVVSLLI